MSNIPVLLSTTIHSDKDTEALISLYTGLVGLCQANDSTTLHELRDQLKETLCNQFPQNWEEISSEIEKVAALGVKMADEYKDFSLEDN